MSASNAMLPLSAAMQHTRATALGGVATAARATTPLAFGQQRRYASSSNPARPPPPSPAASPLSSAQSTPPPQAPGSRDSVHITWPQYFQLRKSKDLFGKATLYPTVPLSLASSGYFFLSSELNPMQSIFGLDPIILSVGAVLASGFGGYLVGPLIGTGLWSLSHRSKRKALQERDAEFYEHIRRNRVDPSRANMQNPVPDFYGEKIYSLSDYRRWLRDCSVYRRKAAHGLKQDAPGNAAEEGPNTI